MTGSVIDLGELRHGPEPAPLPRPPRVDDRRLRSALVLLLVLVTVAAAAAPQPRRSALTLPATPGAAVLVDGDLFLVIEPAEAGKTQARLAAYRLPGVERLWQASLPAEARAWELFSVAGMPLVTGFGIGPEESGATSIALDRATGAYRWQQPAGAITLADGNLLLHSGGDTEPMILRAVDSCCGSVRWQLPPTTAEFSARETGHGVDRLVLNHPNGPVEVLDASTGAVLASAALRPPSGAPLGIEVINDLLLAIDRGSGTINAYGLDRLDLRWTGRSGPIEFAADCGPVVCVRTSLDELRAIDLATGQERWRSDRWRWGWPHDGRLMVSTGNDGGPEHYLVLDALSGRQLADLGPWELYQLGVGGRLVGTRKHPDGGVLVGELDIGAGKVRVVDVLPHARGECQVITGRLLCANPAGLYQMWDLPD